MNMLLVSVFVLGLAAGGQIAMLVTDTTHTGAHVVLSGLGAVAIYGISIGLAKRQR